MRHISRIEIGEEYVTKSGLQVTIVHYSKKNGYWLGVVHNEKESQVHYTINGYVMGDANPDVNPMTIMKPVRPRLELIMCKKADGTLVGPSCSPVSWTDRISALKKNKERLANEGAKLIVMREV